MRGIRIFKRGQALLLRASFSTTFLLPMQQLRLLALSLLSLGATAAVTAAVPTTSSLHTQRAIRSSYQDGYNQGLSETTSNKCIDGVNFENNYATYYRPRAEQNYQNDPSDYYQGYLDGQDAGYNTPVLCR